MSRQPDSFEDFKLVKPLLQAVKREQFREPTPIQEQAIPRILQGRDVLGIAQTGTGKTAAFALPILHNVSKKRHSPRERSCQVLVLSPTRELATQTASRFERFGVKLNLRQICVYGGVSEKPQIRALRKGVHLLIATPGRLMDLMKQGHVELSGLNTFVLDEADRMLDMGFLPDIEQIVSELPAKRQSLFFSATMPGEIKELVEELLYKPVRINVTPPESDSQLLNSIDQRVCFVEFDKKLLLLNWLLRKHSGQTLVFTRTKQTAHRLGKNLQDEGLLADSLHKDRSQKARERILKDFRAKALDVIVATDVASRGLDIDGISLVVNFDLPRDAETYLHRVGRTGRAGQQGTAVSVCCEENLPTLKLIESQLNTSLRVENSHTWHVPSLALQANNG